MNNQMTLDSRLKSMEYDEDDIIGALRGQRLPLHLGFRLLKLCVISGILHHPSFAQGEAATLAGLADHPEFTRALNARAIMSNRIPEMDPASRPEEIPYCIWYPKPALEDTYRQLIKRYPELRYQVARSCAVAGYTKLYLELDDVLPEVSVAEEARDANSSDIFNHILKQPIQYKVMDDCFLAVNLSHPQHSPLNGNTCVSSMIKREKQKFRPIFKDSLFSTGFKHQYFNLLEDEGISEAEPEEPVWSSSDMMLELLTSPLPVHLPAGNKDFLIFMAAYHGNIDRYHRLRRSRPIQDEYYFVVRGIYHNPLFALWWERQQNPPKGEPLHMPDWMQIQKAIMARHIMNNDLSVMSTIDPEATTSEYSTLPYLIWYPDRAMATTYKALAHKVPAMRESCIRAAIYCGYKRLFDELLLLPGVKPTLFLALEAEDSDNPHFISELQRRAEELGVSIAQHATTEPWKERLASSASIKLNNLCSYVGPQLAYRDSEDIYNGIRAMPDDLEIYLMAPESWRVEGETVWLDYEEWPENWIDHTQ